MGFKYRRGSFASSHRLGALVTCFLLSVIMVHLDIRDARADAPEDPKDTVVFINGDRLSGHLKQANSDSVTFVGDVTKLIFLQWKDISEIDLSAKTLCITGKAIIGASVPNDFSLDHAKITVEGTDLVFSSGGTEIHRLPEAQLLSVAPKSPSGNQTASQQRSLLQGWGGPLQSQDSLTSSTQHQYQVGASLHAARATESDEAFGHQITNINLDANFGESKKPGASPVITQVYEAGLQQDIYITDNYDDCGNRRWGGARVLAVTDFYHNLSLGLNLEQAYGVGIAWDRQSGRERYGKQKYGLSVDLRYIGEDLYSPGKPQKLVAANLGQNYQIKLNLVKGKPIILGESGSVIPAFNNSHALQARGVAKLTVPLTTKVSMGVQETDDYLRNAPPKSKQNYSSLQVTFAYALGAAPQ
jgi:hypothetical protein